MPSKFTFTGNNTIEILYDATGQKLRKVVKTNGVETSRQDYLGGIELKNNRLESIYNEEGRAYNTSNATQVYPYTWRYEYNLKDHLGNTRLVFTDKNNNGKIDDQTEVLQETHYYPFGMTFNGSWYTDNTASKYKYQYNGKELNEDFGLNMSDYGARWYDASIGRWWSVDPLAEKYRKWSPYTYTADNPIRFIDPDGMSFGSALPGAVPNEAEMFMAQQELQAATDKKKNELIAAVDAALAGPSPKAAAAMSAHVYGDKSDSVLQEGWHKIDGDENKSGLKWGLYQSGDQYTLATAGTEDQLDAFQDGKQLLGISEQYSESVALAKKYKGIYGNNLSFTGHSLGGGLATINSKSTGLSAITFNAAGLSLFTEARYFSFSGLFARIDAYVLLTDPLNFAQRLGQNGISLNPANGIPHFTFPFDKSSALNGHSIDNFLKYFGIKF